MRTLDRLAALAGIEPAYHDIFGRHVTTPDATKIALLEAMGLPAGDEAAQAASLAALEARAWGRLLPPVTVVAAEAQPGAVLVSLPAGPDERRLDWRLVAEDGAEEAGQARIGDLAWVEGRAFDGARVERRRLVLPVLAEGYARLSLALEGGGVETGTVITAPRRCWEPDDAAPGARLWGLACQLYALRSDENWGIGNFTDLARLAERAAAEGADLIGLNPLHALFPADPNQISPYSPASRAFLNILAIDPEAVPEFAECPEARARLAEPDFAARLAAARGAEQVDYALVAALLLPVLARLHDCFRARHEGTSSERGRAFAAFRAAEGPPLRLFATFLALQEHLAADDPAMLNWHNWPAEYRDPASPGVGRFAREAESRIDFFEYAQWLADEQLAAAAARARGSGMRVGLYRDLAVGVGHTSAGAWSEPATRVAGVSLGAPPDFLNQRGQNWGLTPPHPLQLAERAYEPLIRVLRANMRHAGALRLDHVMGLMHLYWVPPGLSGAEGAYVAYPFQDLLRVLALESRRARCLVIGEDLGTVPEGFRPAMEEAGVLSYRVLLFERGEGGSFTPPYAYPAAALTVAGTHDLPTLNGFWTGRDIDWRRRLDLYHDAAAREGDEAGRLADKRRLAEALAAAGVLDGAAAADLAARPALDRDGMIAIYRFLARTPSRLLMVQLEDLLLQVEQMNLPGTVAEHPNWRRRLGRPLDALFAEAGPLFAALRQERG